MAHYQDNHDDYAGETESVDMALSVDMMKAMQEVEKVMGGELDKLKARKQDLRTGQQALDNIRKRIEAVSCSSPNRLKLNVGGKKIELKMTHVERNNFFRPLLTNAFTQPDAEGFYFIDRDPAFVMVIVNFLRGGIEALDLDLFTPAQLRRIVRDAEFYMVQGLQDKVDEMLKVRGPQRRISTVAINAAPPARYFNGVFMQITPLHNLTLTSVSFICGEKRPNLIARALLFETGIASLSVSTQMREIGAVDEPVTAVGAKVTISMTALTLQSGRTYTIGVYSSLSSVVGGVPSQTAERRFNDFTIGGTFHTTDSRHALAKKVENEFDFVGELCYSLA